MNFGTLKRSLRLGAAALLIASLGAITPGVLAPATGQSVDQPLGASEGAITGLVRRGARGEAVRAIQKLLRRHGHSVGIDGVFGPQTEAAVRAFQRGKGLLADGVVGPQTRSALTAGATRPRPEPERPAEPTPAPADEPGESGDAGDNGLAGTISEEVNNEEYRDGRDMQLMREAAHSGGLRRGSRGEAVRALQRRLSELGYPTSTDGVFGPATEASLKRLQRDRGLSADGVVGSRTLGALGDSAPSSPAPTPSEPAPAEPPTSSGAPRVERRLATGTLIVPAGYAPASNDYKLLIHFHGAQSAVEREHRASGYASALLVVNFNGFSSAYLRPFSDSSRFVRMLDDATRELGRARGHSRPQLSSLTLCSFSAGYGAIREILRHNRSLSALRGVILCDSLHASYAGGRNPDPNQMAPFYAFARRAAANSRLRLIVSHSSIVPGSYASTTETANAILSHIGAAVTPASGTGRRGMRLKSRTQRGGVLVLGYHGGVASDHIDQLQTIGDLFGELD